MLFNILKTIHIFSVIAWMAGLLYLPRLFVYHADKKITKETSETFKIMERRLFKFIMTPAFVFTWLTGLAMIHYLGLDIWLILKILFVFLLTGYHFFCQICLQKFSTDQNIYSPKFFRITNEVPAVILIFIIILVVFKPF